MDSIKDIIEQIHHRLSNPLVSTFVLAWSALNWRVFLYFFGGNLSPKERISSIQNLYSPGSKLEITGGGFLELIIYPLMIALAYLFLLPYLTSLYRNKYGDRMEAQRLRDRAKDDAKIFAEVEDWYDLIRMARFGLRIAEERLRNLQVEVKAQNISKEERRALESAFYDVQSIQTKYFSITEQVLSGYQQKELELNRKAVETK